MTNIKPAATILLGRDQNDALEILLLKRNKALAFAAGLWVFPGGKIEPFESEQSTSDLDAAKTAGVRETMEEAKVKIRTEDLIFFRHWTTPEIQPKRFATWFFFAGANHLTTEVEVDDSEIKEHLWITPQSALDRVKDGTLGMMPPTIMSLQLIRKCKSVEEVREKLAKEKPIFTIPRLQMKDTKMFCLYEGDAGYTLGKEEAPGARHRLVFDLSSGNFDFEYQGCEDRYQPVNGGMHL